MSAYPAARVTDSFGHDGGLGGLLAGVAVGALIGVGIIATGGLGALAVGAALATTGAAGMAGAALGMMMAGPVTGQLDTGSPNVIVNNLAATMVQLGIGHCANHATPRLVATGSATVLINGLPAARVSELMDCTAVIRTGSLNVLIGGPKQSPVCTALRGEEAKLEQFRIDAQAATAAYDPPDKRQPPDNYRNATPADLQRLGLSEAMLEHPIDPKTGKPTEFRAAVFMNDKTGAPLVAFKGTSPTSREDWATNFGQGRGKETFYYDQAQRVARRIATSPDGAEARLTGHSLGGGMASAGAEASGLPATTFNAAGLNAQTVSHPVSANIDAVYVEGEALRASQSVPRMPHSASTTTWPLAAVDYRNQALAVGARGLGPIIAGAAFAVRAGLLHMMGAVDAALANKRAITERALAKNGCL